jgi:hypothetical protein
MRDEYGNVLVFVARPLSPWQALNTNILIDLADCEIGAFPKS